MRTMEGVGGMGWLPDVPDIRDYDPGHRAVAEVVSQAGLAKFSPGQLSNRVDLRRWCPPVEDQGRLGSCTANAAAGLMEYYENRATGRYLDASRLFIYKATRNLLGLTGDTGAYLRSTMQAMVVFGAPPEEYWAYDIGQFDAEPPAFCYAFGLSYKAVKYVRLDSPGVSEQDVLHRIKAYLNDGLPSMFGFPVYRSIAQAEHDGGKIPLPCLLERPIGGHALAAVGYDDGLVIKNGHCGTQTKGALLVRNSWGSGWGDKGYGWLPYDYVLKELAVDWWTLLNQQWIDTGRFGPEE